MTSYHVQAGQLLDRLLRHRSFLARSTSQSSGPTRARPIYDRRADEVSLEPLLDFSPRINYKGVRDGLRRPTKDDEKPDFSGTICCRNRATTAREWFCGMTRRNPQIG